MRNGGSSVTIEEGTGDEFLLTCFVCKNPFGLVAQFCGYCQATRQQALGVERARPNQQILGVQAEVKTQAPVAQAQPAAPNFAPQKPNTPPPPRPIARPVAKPVKPPKQRSMFLENAGLRSKNIGIWQTKNSKPIVLVGLACFIFSTYFSIQSLVFVASSPLAAAEDHLYLGASRNTEYFDDFSENSGVRFFPSKFSAWPDSNAARWSSNASWNGWKGEASVDFVAGGADLDGIPITGKLKAEYSTTLGIFRKIKWVPEAPAVLTLDYPRRSNVSIYINGLAAGTTSRPSVSEGTYQIYPGPLTLTFYDLSTGEEITDYYRYYFIDAQGQYEVSFN